MGQTLSDFHALTKSMIKKDPPPPPPPPKPAEDELSREDQAVLDFFTHGAASKKAGSKGAAASVPKVEVVSAKASAVLREKEENFKRAELQARAEAAEAARAEAEQTRDAAIAECAAAAAAQVTAEVERDAAVAERDAAQAAQKDAETARDAAVAAQQAAEQMRDATATAQRAAEARAAELAARVQELEAQLAAAQAAATMSVATPATGTVPARPSGPSGADLLAGPAHFREAFAGETREMVIAALAEARDTAEQSGRDRRAMVLEAVLWANPSSGELARRKAALKQILKDDAYRTDPAALEKLGFRLVSGRTHWKLEYAGVRMPLAKTPSDFRANLNSAAEMSNRCF